MSDRDPAPPADDDPDTRDFPGAESLRGQSPMEVLHRLLDHDPFELQTRSIGRLEERALLISERRVYLRALARVAYGAPRYRGEPPLDDWLAGRIDQAIEEILEEDLEAELANEPIPVPYESRLVSLAEGLGLEIGMTRRACLRFNALPDRVRRTFFALAIHGKTLKRHVAEGNGPPLQVHADLHDALSALSAYADPDDLDLGEVPW